MQQAITANVVIKYIPSSMLGELNCSKLDVSACDFDLSTASSQLIHLHSEIFYEEKQRIYQSRWVARLNVTFSTSRCGLIKL